MKTITILFWFITILFIWIPKNLKNDFIVKYKRLLIKILVIISTTFKIHARYTYEDFIALNKIAQKNFHKFKNRIFKPFSVIVGTLLAIMSVFLLLDGSGVEWYFYLALGILLVIYNLLLEPYICAYYIKKKEIN